MFNNEVARLHKNFDRHYNYLENNELINNIKVLKSVDKLNIELEKMDGYLFPVNKKDINKIKINIYHLSVVEAPLDGGVKIGELRVISNNKILCTLDVKVIDKISKKNYKNYMMELLYDIKKCF